MSDYFTLKNQNILTPPPNISLGSSAKPYANVISSSVAIGNNKIKIINVTQVVKTDTFTSASTAFANVTGLLITVSPINANSKFLLISDLSVGPNPGAGSFTQRFARDGNAITAYIGDAAGSRPRGMATAYSGDSAGTAGYLGITKMYLDSPNTTSNVTYTIQVAGSTTTPGFINRSQADRDTTGYDARSASSFTVMEIGG